MIYIYALIDPFTKHIRYIGKSIRPYGRLADHCNDHSVTWRTHWIQSVLAKGGRPEIAILEEIPDDADWQSAEKRWIAHGNDMGWPLTNCTEGGDGVPGLPPEIRKIMASTWLGRRHTPQALEKMRIASTGRIKSEASKERMRQIMTGRKIEWVDKVRNSLEKLMACEIREIRRLLDEGILTQKQIAQKFNVDKGTISNIKRRVTYAHVEDIPCLADQTMTGTMAITEKPNQN